MKAPREILHERLAARRAGWLDVRSDLRHFALINYTLPPERLRPHVHERFELATFPIDGQPQAQPKAMISAVPFLDEDFCFRALPFPKWRFGQTNYRAYVIDRETGEPGVWFFGTTLSSRLVHIARWLWRIPWHHSRSTLDCVHDPMRGAYARYRVDTESGFGPAHIELEDTGEPMRLLPGFRDLEEQVLVLTHPITGWFFRLDGQLGTYSVSHEVIPMTIARPRQLQFGLFERLGLVSRDEMQTPHSVLLCPLTTFQVHLPPRRLPLRGSP